MKRKYLRRSKYAMLRPLIIQKRSLRQHFKGKYPQFTFWECMVGEILSQMTEIRYDFVGFGTGDPHTFTGMPTGEHFLDLAFFDDEDEAFAIVEVTSHNYSYDEETGDRACKLVPIVVHKIENAISSGLTNFIVSVFTRNYEWIFYWVTVEEISQYEKGWMKTKYGKQFNYKTPKEIWKPGLKGLAQKIKKLKEDPDAPRRTLEILKPKSQVFRELLKCLRTPEYHEIA